MRTHPAGVMPPLLLVYQLSHCLVFQRGLCTVCMLWCELGVTSNSYVKDHQHLCFMELGHVLTHSGPRVQKPLQRSAMIPSASHTAVFHHPGQSITRHSVYMLYPVSLVFQ
jgi:hypothetical protein